jgi:nickel transport protein
VVALHATYDSGDPMAGGQVSVYAPNDLSTPWQTGVCDSDGQYTFVPDTSITGVWEVQVRQAGHGDLAYITIAAPADGGGDGEHTASAPIVLQQQPGYTPLQIALMSGCVVWGFVGTALFFQRSKKG